MKRSISLYACLFAGTLGAWACGSSTAGAPPLPAAERERVEAFRADLDETRTSLGIRRMTAAVVREGRTEWVGAFGDATPSTRFPIDQLTEAFTAIAALRIESRGALRLDAPVADLDPAFPGPRSVLVRHLLSHTSEEVPGATFHFDSGEFARLTPLLAAAAGKPFPAVLESEVLRPAAMGAVHGSPALTAAGGLVASVGDLARLEAALRGSELLSPESLRRLTSPTYTPNGFLPYGLGWFVTWTADERMIWAFGESDEASSLFFRLPDRGLAFVLLGEGPEGTRPFHLDRANPLRSPFVLAFLRRFAPLGDEARRLIAIDALVDRALVLQARRDAGAAAAFRAALAARGTFASADPALLAALARTSEPDLLAVAETLGRQVQAGGWDNAPTLLDLAILDSHAGRREKAADELRGLLARKNVRSAAVLAEAQRLLDDVRARP